MGRHQHDKTHTNRQRQNHLDIFYGDACLQLIHQNLHISLPDGQHGGKIQDGGFEPRKLQNLVGQMIQFQHLKRRTIEQEHGGRGGFKEPFHVFMAVFDLFHRHFDLLLGWTENKENFQSQGKDGEDQNDNLDDFDRFDFELRF